MIGPNHPVREAFADCSTGKYYNSKVEAHRTFNAVLKVYGYHLESRIPHGSSGYRTIIIRNDCNDLVGHAYFSWYRTPCFWWEIIGYIT